MGRSLYPLAVLIAITVGALGGLFSAPDTSPAAETVQVLWMSGVIKNQRACVGVAGLHRNYAYDLFADDDGPCYGPSSTSTSLRTIGFSSTFHRTLAAYIVSGEYPYPSYCDYIEARTVEHGSGLLRGTYRYLHARGSSGYWVDIWSGPNLPRLDVLSGTTRNDSNCSGGWVGYHTHQDASSPKSEPNWNLPRDDDIPVWDLFFYIHKWTYTEGVP